MVHRFTGVAPTRRAAHPVGPGRRLRGRWPSTPPSRACALGTDQLQRLPGQRLHARQRDQPRPGRTPQGDRPPAGVRRHHGRHRLARPQAVVLRRHQLPGPGRHPGPPGPARRGARARSTTGSATTSGCCWSTSSSSRPSTRPTCRTGARRTRTASQLGPKAQVVIDTGHHAPGTNIEFIVAFLLRAGRLGGFDFNSRFYADDDLMVGAADPFQLFRIMHEIVAGRRARPDARASRSCSTSATTSSRRSRRSSGR